jgi:hypothetical protein
MYHRGLCANCACRGVLLRLFGDDGQLSGSAAQIIEALLKCDRSAVLHWARRTALREPLAEGIREMGDILDHDTLDRLPTSKSVEWLRNVLVDAGALPHRDARLHRIERFIDTQLASIDNRDDRAAARAYTTWHHLRKLREQAARGPLKRGHGMGAQQEIVAVAAFLVDLRMQGLTLAMCRQQHVDDWLVRNPTRARINQFLAWAVRRGNAHDVAASPPESRRTRDTLTGDDERWQLIERLIQDPLLQTRDRVAGLFVLLYSQQTARLVTLKVADVTINPQGPVELKLGAVPLIVPAPLDRFLTELVQQRRGYGAVTAGDNTWLFPGGHAGQHISSTHMGVRLRRIGISPRIARNTALIDLAGELPAAVLAKLLGFSIKRAVTWNIEAGNTNPRYAAAVVRRSPHR